MMTLSEFARTVGAKDEQPRKKRNVMGYLGAGGVLGVGGVGASKYYGNKASEGMDKIDKKLYSKVFTDAAEEANYIKPLYKKYKVFRNRNLAYGALGVGALGTGLMAKGAYNAIKNRQEGN